MKRTGASTAFTQQVATEVASLIPFELIGAPVKKRPTLTQISTHIFLNYFI